jgi:hypothetical protein
MFIFSSYRDDGVGYGSGRLVNEETISITRLVAISYIHSESFSLWYALNEKKE